MASWLTFSRVSDPREKEKESKMEPDLYNLILEVTYHHFCCILLVTQISYSLRESDIHKNVNIRRQELWAILKAGYNHPIPQQPIQYWPVVGT